MTTRRASYITLTSIRLKIQIVKNCQAVGKIESNVEEYIIIFVLNNNPYHLLANIRMGKTKELSLDLR